MCRASFSTPPRACRGQDEQVMDTLDARQHPGVPGHQFTSACDSARPSRLVHGRVFDHQGGRRMTLWLCHPRPLCRQSVSSGAQHSWRATGYHQSPSARQQTQVSTLDAKAEAGFCAGRQAGSPAVKISHRRARSQVRRKSAAVLAWLLVKSVICLPQFTEHAGILDRPEGVGNQHRRGRWQRAAAIARRSIAAASQSCFTTIRTPGIEMNGVIGRHRSSATVERA